MSPNPSTHASHSALTHALSHGVQRAGSGLLVPSLLLLPGGSDSPDTSTHRTAVSSAYLAQHAQHASAANSPQQQQQQPPPHIQQHARNTLTDVPSNPTPTWTPYPSAHPYSAGVRVHKVQSTAPNPQQAESGTAHRGHLPHHSHIPRHVPAMQPTHQQHTQTLAPAFTYPVQQPMHPTHHSTHSRDLPQPSATHSNSSLLISQPHHSHSVPIPGRSFASAEITPHDAHQEASSPPGPRCSVSPASTHTSLASSRPVPISGARGPRVYRAVLSPGPGAGGGLSGGQDNCGVQVLWEGEEAGAGPNPPLSSSSVKTSRSFMKALVPRSRNTTPDASTHGGTDLLPHHYHTRSSPSDLFGVLASSPQALSVLFRATGSLKVASSMVQVGQQAHQQQHHAPARQVIAQPQSMRHAQPMRHAASVDNLQAMGAGAPTQHGRTMQAGRGPGSHAGPHPPPPRQHPAKTDSSRGPPAPAPAAHPQRSRSHRQSDQGGPSDIPLGTNSSGSAAHFRVGAASVCTADGRGQGRGGWQIRGAGRGQGQGPSSCSPVDYALLATSLPAFALGGHSFRRQVSGVAGSVTPSMSQDVSMHGGGGLGGESQAGGLLQLAGSGQSTWGLGPAHSRDDYQHQGLQAQLRRMSTGAGMSVTHLAPAPLPVCLICLEFLTPQDFQEGQAMQLKCMCRGDLAMRHRACAIEWSIVKGDLLCDICKHPIDNLPEIDPAILEAREAARRRRMPNFQTSSEPTLCDWLFDAVRVTWLTVICIILFAQGPSLSQTFLIGSGVGVGYALLAFLLHWWCSACRAGHAEAAIRREAQARAAEQTAGGRQAFTGAVEVLQQQGQVVSEDELMVPLLVPGGDDAGV